MTQVDKGVKETASVRAQTTESKMPLNAREGAGEATVKARKVMVNGANRTAKLLAPWEAKRKPFREERSGPI